MTKILQCSYLMIIYLSQLKQETFSPVKETRLQIVLSQLVKRLKTELIIKVFACYQVLMNTGCTLKLSPATIEVAQSHMHLNRIGVHLQHPHKSLDRLVRLLIQ